MIVDIVFGFLGVGKTTFIINVLKETGIDEKTVVLVNEFGDVGIDGDLLTVHGQNVVEMPSGCICCTLQTDFRSQMLDIIQRFSPHRVIIEPTGVATIEQIRSIVSAQLFEDSIEKIHTIMIADATGFMDLYKANRHFVESQVEHAHIVLLNKCDRVEKRKARVIQSAISAINPHITIMMTQYGKVDWAEYRQALSTPFSKGTDTQLGSLSPFHLLPDEKEELGYKTVGKVYDSQIFNDKSLELFFQKLSAADSGMGEIVRAKGIFQTGGKWLLMELASGGISSQPLKQFNQSKISIIGNDLNRKMIIDALDQCVSKS